MNRLIPLEKETPPSAVLRITNGPHKGKQLRLLASVITIGRHSDCDIVLKDNKSCSRKHARIIRKNEVYSIESLKKENPVLINKQVVLNSQILKEGDIVTLGDLICIFSDNKQKSLIQYKTPQTARSLKKSQSENILSNKAALSQKAKKQKEKKMRLLLVLAAAGIFLFLLISENNKKTAIEKEEKKIRTEQDLAEELEAMQTINKEEEEKIRQLAPEEGQAQIAFIKGFRDYRKGYYYRAEKHFNHCLTLNKKYEICESYARQARTQIERIIQRKMILGKEYRKHNQYQSCAAIFKSVEIMITDRSHILFKEARENRKFCEMKTKNKM